MTFKLLPEEYLMIIFSIIGSFILGWYYGKRGGD